MPIHAIGGEPWHRLWLDRTRRSALLTMLLLPRPLVGAATLQVGSAAMPSLSPLAGACDIRDRTLAGSWRPSPPARISPDTPNTFDSSAANAPTPAPPQPVRTTTPCVDH